MQKGNTPKNLLILGCGYVGQKLAQACLTQGIHVKATVRNIDKALLLQKQGIDAVVNDQPETLNASWLRDCDAVLDSIPLSYDNSRIPFQTQSSWVAALTSRLPHLTWAGYISSTSVYADSNGAWIDETSNQFSTSPRGAERLKAEQAWLNAVKYAEIFRPAGIYGDDRNIVDKLKTGNYKTVNWQPARYSNRIHVDDMVTAILAAMNAPQPQRIINLADDTPCSHMDYASALAKATHAPDPIILSPEEAEIELSPAYLDFFRDHKRISNQRLKQDLLPTLKYPSFRDSILSLNHKDNHEHT